MFWSPPVMSPPTRFALCSLQLGGREGVARENRAAESGREALHLGFDASRHVGGRPVRYVAISPRGVLAGGRAASVEQAGLG